MGHSTQHYTFDLKRSRKDIESIVNEDARENSDNHSELSSFIRFLENKIYEDREEAEMAIERFDKGWYDQLAVQFNDFEKVKDTKQIINLMDRIEKSRTAIVDYKAKNSIKLRKTQFVGCTKCGSKINKEYISDRGHSWNKCPLCGEDLTSDTIKNSIINKEKNVDDLRVEYNKLRKINEKKGKKSVKWLVKTEYHI